MGTQAPLHVQHKKLDWFYAPCFTAFWIVLYMAVVLQQVNHLPTPLTLQDEFTQPDSFITERAENVLLNLTNLGPRVVGSEANEVEAVTLILDQVFKVQNEMNQDYFDIEVDLQVVSGQYMHTSLYHGVQNILAKLSAKNNTSTNYLLINSHFDSTPKSPGASDDGAMVAVMLEILRVMANSKGPLEHPIVFLFNGAEEDGLLASYGFTTQHKWAKNCKVIINLDAAGAGGREILFQSISESSWLMNYYSKVPHPFANAVLEELFQFGLVPSATDFRNFRDYGGMQGFDMAYIQNGYVYHTEFDSFKVYPKASLQNTGDNVLSLAKSLGNAPEMRNIIPLYLLFRRTRSIILCSLGVAILFMILAIRPIGTPYTPKLAPQRYTVQHANQLYHNADGSIRSNESAIYLYQQDRHIDIAEEVIKKFKAAHETSTVCNNEATCQLDRPSIFYTPNSLWLPVNEPPGIPYERPVLTLTAKTIMNTPNTVRYNYTLTGPDHMMFFIEPKTSAKIINWSFDKTILSRKRLVFTFVHGKNNDAFEFFIDLECHSNNTNTQSLEIV